MKSLFRDVSELPEQDQGLVKQAFRIGSAVPRPHRVCIELAHSAEIEHWQHIDMSSIAEFSDVHFGDIFVLNVEGLAYFATCLIALCFLAKSGHYGCTIFRTLDEQRTGFCELLGKARADICMRLLNRLEQVMWSCNPVEIQVYPGVSIAADPENGDYQEELLNLTAELKSMNW